MATGCARFDSVHYDDFTHQLIVTRSVLDRMGVVIKTEAIPVHSTPALRPIRDVSWAVETHVQRTKKGDDKYFGVLKVDFTQTRPCWSNGLHEIESRHTIRFRIGADMKFVKWDR